MEPHTLSPRAAWLLGGVLLATSLTSTIAAAQVEVAAGVLLAPEPGPDGTRFGPALSVGVSGATIGLPLYFEAGYARTDFTSLGQAYHDNHYSLILGAEWFPSRAATRVGLRLGAGAYGERQVVETNPPSPGGNNWIEAVVPGLVVEHGLGGGRRLIVGISDFLLGPYFAILDSSEYSIEHRIRVTVGLRF